MKKKIFVILLMCVFIVSVIPVSSSAKIYSFSGVFKMSDAASVSSSANTFYGVFSVNGDFYNRINLTSTEIRFSTDGVLTYSKSISSLTNSDVFSIYYLCSIGNNISNQELILYNALNGKKVGNVTDEPVLSTKYNINGKWILKSSLDIQNTFTGFVNYYIVNTNLNNTDYYNNLSVMNLSNAFRLVCYNKGLDFFEFYSTSSGWSHSFMQTINISDSYFITDEAAESFYNWLCNNALSYNDGPVPDPTVPPDTQPPDTQPPDTQPPDTQPPDTETPDTETPDTDTPVIPPADRFGFQAMMTGLSYSLFGENGLAVQIWSWLVSPTVLPFFGIGIALALLLLAILIVKRTF